MILAMWLVAAVAGVAPAQQAAPAGAAGDAAQGKKDLVAYYCYSCHGYSGEGADTGPRLDTNKWTQANFMAYVRKGGRQMPRFAQETKLSDAALANIYAFLKARPANPDPKSLTLLDGK
jgi:cytochrome c553